MNPFLRHILRKLLADYGTTLLDEPERVDASLADLCGEYGRERFLLVLVLRDRIPAELLAQPHGIALLLSRLTRRLEERYGLSAEAAQWAIDSWAIVLDERVRRLRCQASARAKTLGFKSNAHEFLLVK